MGPHLGPHFNLEMSVIRFSMYCLMSSLRDKSVGRTNNMSLNLYGFHSEHADKQSNAKSSFRKSLVNKKSF